MTGTEHVFPARSGRIIGFAGGTLVAFAVAAAAAFAAAPVTGATYTGALAGQHPKITISFRVSASGREVENLRIGRLPIYCGGSGPPGTPRIKFKNAAISANGSFSSPGKDMIATGPLKGSVVATLRVSGSFSAGGHERGTVTTTYSGPAKNCGGHSAYATTG
ncbi:MAG TPA: hypothetical protein VNC12_10975 [Solirubrobacteraceae bacterium]|nr:hypothetical protein [Solirubrobacteraceae bacterium]